MHVSKPVGMLTNPHTPQEMKNAKELVQATNPGFSWHKSAIDTWHPSWMHFPTPPNRRAI